MSRQAAVVVVGSAATVVGGQQHQQASRHQGAGHRPQGVRIEASAWRGGVEHHQVVLAEGRPEGVPSTINQLSFTVNSLSELRVMYRRVVAAEVENLLPRNHGNAWSVYFDDPEGNNIEVYLDSPFHVPQPFGEYLDFELSDDEIVKLTEEMCRATEGYRPRDEWSADLAAEMAKS